jgi:hypothetical protein
MAISYPGEVAEFVRSKTHPVWCMAISPWIFPFMTMQDVPDPEKPETWKFFLMLSWLGEVDSSLDEKERIKALKERGAKLAEASLYRLAMTRS